MFPQLVTSNIIEFYLADYPVVFRECRRVCKEWLWLTEKLSFARVVLRCTNHHDVRKDVDLLFGNSATLCYGIRFVKRRCGFIRSLKVEMLSEELLGLPVRLVTKFRINLSIGWLLGLAHQLEVLDISDHFSVITETALARAAFSHSLRELQQPFSVGLIQAVIASDPVYARDPHFGRSILRVFPRLETANMELAVCLEDIPNVKNVVKLPPALVGPLLCSAEHDRLESLHVHISFDDSVSNIAVPSTATRRLLKSIIISEDDEGDIIGPGATTSFLRDFPELSCLLDTRYIFNNVSGDPAFVPRGLHTHQMASLLGEELSYLQSLSNLRYLSITDMVSCSKFHFNQLEYAWWKRLEGISIEPWCDARDITWNFVTDMLARISNVEVLGLPPLIRKHKRYFDISLVHCTLRCCPKLRWLRLNQYGSCMGRTMRDGQVEGWLTLGEIETLLVYFGRTQDSPLLVLELDGVCTRRADEKESWHLLELYASMFNVAFRVPERWKWPWQQPFEKV